MKTKIPTPSHSENLEAKPAQNPLAYLSVQRLEEMASSEEDPRERKRILWFLNRRIRRASYFKEVSKSISSDPERYAKKLECARRSRQKHKDKLRIRDPKKQAARMMVYLEIKSGKLKRGPCEVCGKPDTQGHHDDYDKPLDVRWLCTKHHKQFHLENPTIK